ncbi:hypothetical protein H6G97_20890 [Nostoc flagelliforme FACHB-838]|uniref:Uncharacterized protein n=1 Tax=Nostoc flagelliforme FACHB-838 TaxID=2692904 RepID=A0ABR8DR14_9NOSO|nr:hypothetical protein [Nostoc flagelliforme]MBD2531907.1 hypothetical protein [Nostoc flagelliforme FACHB-838]
MKRFTLLLISLLIFSPTQALAIPARVVYSQDAQGINSSGIDLKVWSGYGLTINFIPTGEIIKQVWIGDPSRISFTSNGDLCQKNTSNQDCTNAGATVLFLRHIKPIDFPNITSSGDGSTQITILTSGTNGQKQYQFKLIPSTGKPTYTSLVIKPDSSRPNPVLLARERLPVTPIKKPSPPQQTVTPTNHQNVTAASVVSSISTLPLNNSTQRSDANAIAYGLTIANRNGTIKLNSPTWKKAQDAIRLLRRGKSREEAASLSGVTLSVFNQLLDWGQNR